jgi:hypothetical protein
MYESQYVCVVCQSDSCQLHHIDKNNANNNRENLVVLCLKHHDEAHTVRELSKNLDAKALIFARQNWLATVRRKRELAATLAGQIAAVGSDSFFAAGITWGYINHSRVSQLVHIDCLSADAQSLLSVCCSRSIVDKNGIIIKPADRALNASPVRNTVYDWFEFGDDHRLHKLYSIFVDQISLAGDLVHMEPESWSASAAKELLLPGTMVFVTRRFSFKAVSKTIESEHLRCRTKKGDLSLEFFVDTLNMFGTTSITVSFSGTQTCSALVLIKSLNESEDGHLTLTATPMALGIGFQAAQRINGAVPSTIPHLT